jgi:serine phosphatase RsbU (regulator of sigma subunit)
MRGFTIRLKLGLLAGIPVLGALVLGLLIAASAKRSAETAAELGSVEELAAVVASIGELVDELESERALVARSLVPPAKPAPSVEPQWAETEAARLRLLKFMSQRELASMPERLSRNLETWRKADDELGNLRARAKVGAASMDDVMSSYQAAIRALIGATAALAQLTEDGEILRNVNASVAMLELKERASARQAWISHVLTLRDFPAGSYKALVTLRSEEQTFDDVFRLSAPRKVLTRASANPKRAEYTSATSLEEQVLAAIDNEFPIEEPAWFAAQQAKVTLLGETQRALVSGVREAAEAKMHASRRAALLGGGTAGLVLTLSVALALFITRGILRSVRGLQEAVERVGRGDLDARVVVRTRDELGHLGEGFNSMVSELKQHRNALREQAMLRREIEIAMNIQQALLPPAPSHAEFEFSGRMLPAEDVGGDFYDVLTDAERDRLWITVGDVSGHGLTAGLIMLMAQSAFGTHFRADGRAEPDAVLRAVNGLLCEAIAKRLLEDKYVTAQLWIYEGDGAFAVAGAHVWPIVYRQRTRRCELIEATGPWLGIVDELPEIPVQNVKLEPGDVLCLYSDGLTEARSGSGELFDVERMMRAVEEEVSSKTLSDAAAAVIERVSAHARKREDDWTLLLVKRRSEAAPS